MPKGRCSGCGDIDACTKVEKHVLNCDRYLNLYRTRPDQCLDPAAEYQRWRSDEDSSAARALARDVRLAGRFADLETVATAQADRWRTPRDILDD